MKLQLHLFAMVELYMHNRVHSQAHYILEYS